MLFEFEKVRNFSAAHLHTNNLFTKDVQVNLILTSRRGITEISFNVPESWKSYHTYSLNKKRRIKQVCS